MASAASQLWEILLGKRAIQDFSMDEVNEKVSKAIKNLTKGIREDIANASMELPQAEIEMPIKEMSIDDAKTYQDFFRELYDMQDASEGKLKELAYKFGEDMLEIDADWQQESKEAWADYQKELAEIAQKEKDDIAEAEKDLAKDIADLNKDTQRDEADAARKYRENELKAERDYQEKLRRLKEEFLYDLEDALRERDALQVLRLIRRYKLDVEQLQRQNEEEQQERQDSYRQELEDIRRQKEEKLQELQEEHAERLAEIREQAEKEREEAANSYAEKIAELNAQYVQERADRQAQYEQDKQDLVDALEAQVKAAIQKFIEMNNLTGDQVALLSATLKNVFGVGGVAEGAFSEFGLNLQNLTLLAEVEVNKIRGYLEGLAADIEMIGLYSATLPTTTPGNPLGVAGGANLPSSVPGYASGVQNMLLTRPHLFMAGEVPEVMNITPVSQLASGKSGGSGKGTLEISLSEGLVGTIIDNTLGEVAIVMKDRLR
jgi:gas vesicle protein